MIKEYVGKGKFIGKYGTASVNLNLSKIGATGQIYTSAKTGEDYISICIDELKEPDMYGNTLSCYVLPKKDGMTHTQTRAEEKHIAMASQMPLKRDSHETAKSNAFQPQQSNDDIYDDNEDIPF